MRVFPEILITGGSGFLGKAVAAALPGARALGSRDVDLTDGHAVTDFIRQAKAEVVVHLAARVGGITANLAEPADFIVDNLRIDANLCAALRHTRPRHFIVMLSTCMYPDEVDASLYPMPETLLEAGPPPPTNAAYAAAKRALWHATCALHSQYAVPFTALVPANLYGPGDHVGSTRSHFLAAAIAKIEAARQSQAPRIAFLGTGRALRQYVYAPDVGQLVRTIAEHGAFNTIFNVAPQASHSIQQLAQRVADAAGYAGEVAFTQAGPDGQFRKDVTSARLQAAIPAWSSIETPLDRGITLTLEWYRRHVASR